MGTGTDQGKLGPLPLLDGLKIVGFLADGPEASVTSRTPLLCRKKARRKALKEPGAGERGQKISGDTSQH